MGADVPERERAVLERQRHLLLFAGIEPNFGEGLQLLRGSGHRRLYIVHVALHDFGAPYCASIRHPHANDGAVPRRFADLEGRIRPAVSEREPRTDVPRVVPAVAAEHALAVVDLSPFTGIVGEGRRVLEPVRNRRRQLA